MNYTFFKIAVATILASMTLVACQAPSESATEKTETTEVVTNPVVENAESATMEEGIVFNANLATEVDLMKTGISAEMVKLLLEKRPFITMNELDALLGQDTDKEVLYTKLFVPFNLNTTPEADFKMIPGVGDKMAHEFEEYRPYKSIKQFRKAIGKYVDDSEVARYEKYVFVPVELNTAAEEDIKALPGVGDKMAHEFDEYRPYSNMKQFQKQIGKYVDDKELKRLERLVYLEK